MAWYNMKCDATKENDEYKRGKKYVNSFNGAEVIPVIL